MVHETFTAIKTALHECTCIDDIQVIEGGEHADLASTVAFGLAKQQKKSRVLIAQEIVTKLATHPELVRMGISVETKGPYINFRFGSGYVRDIPY